MYCLAASVTSMYVSVTARQRARHPDARRTGADFKLPDFAITNYKLFPLIIPLLTIHIICIALVSGTAILQK